MEDRIVLHVDVDAFFVQVEQRRHPQLRDKPVAIQQHQDIIAANDEAKRHGVRKHMAPAEARKLLQLVGGVVWHVHCEEGGRVSYKPYREASAALMALLQGLPFAATVEKASIDEAYILLARQHAYAAADMQSGLRCGATVRAEALRRLGLTVTVGVARNKLLSKLAALAAKPDGIKGVEGEAEVDALLAHTPAARLPGCGGKLAGVLRGAGIHSAKDLRAWPPARLRSELGVKPDLAQQLAEWGRGRCSAPVAERGPPRSLSVKMSLTPVPLPAHPRQRGPPVAGGRHPGMLEPLRVGGDDYRGRMAQLVSAMARDLLQRVGEDWAQHGRWPRSQGLALTLQPAGGAQRVGSRSCAFPALALKEASGGALEAAYCHNAVQLAAAIAMCAPAHAAVTCLQLECSGFEACGGGAAAAITSFFKPLPPAKGAHDAGAARCRSGEKQGGTADLAAMPSASPGSSGAGSGGERPQPGGEARSGSHAAPDSVSAAACSGGAGRQAGTSASCGPGSAGCGDEGGGDEVELAAVDVREQRRLFEEIERQCSAGAGRIGVVAAKAKRKTGGLKKHGAKHGGGGKQLSIASMLLAKRT